MTRHTARAFGLPLLGMALCLVGALLDPPRAAWWSTLLAGMLAMLVLAAPLLRAGWHATRPATSPSPAPPEAGAPGVAAPGVATTAPSATAVPAVEAFPAWAQGAAPTWEHAPSPATSELAVEAPSTEELETWWTDTSGEAEASEAEAFDLDAAYADLMRSYGYGTVEHEPERAPQAGHRRDAPTSASPWGQPARRDPSVPDTSSPLDTRGDKESGAWVLFDQVLDRYTSLASEAQIRSQRQLWDPPERARRREAASNGAPENGTPDAALPRDEDEERKALSRIWSIDV